MRPNPNPFRSLTDYPRHRAHVGQPQRYDVAAASQFALMFLLGLREHHYLLDYGCGSLRLGRLAIPYLDSGRYFGIEPDLQLVEDGFQHEIGQDIRSLKAPQFSSSIDVEVPPFPGTMFDMIVAQSVFSHTGATAMSTALAGLARSLAPGGLIVANFLLAPMTDWRAPDWLYPACVPYRPDDVVAIAERAGLAIAACPWPHPGLSWFVMARRSDDLPSRDRMGLLAVAPPDWS